MRRYDDPVEVRRGNLDGADGPDQFIWQGRLWQVREVVSHWVETRPWWLGSGSGQTSEAAAADPDLLDEHEVWRVTAIDPGRGVGAAGPTVPIGARGGFGVFDLALNITEGNWKLSRALD